MTQLTVPDSALGHHYQSWWALLLLWDAMSSDPMASVSVEKIADVSRSSGGVNEAFELKRHGQQGYVGDFSVDIWKTLKSWILQQRVLTDTTVQRLCLVTTQIAAPLSAAHFLTAGPERDVNKAIALLQSAAAKSKSEANRNAYAAFTSLGVLRQAELLESVFVIDKTCDFDDLFQRIINRVAVAVGPRVAEEAALRILGWWESRLVDHLAASATDRISAEDLHSRLEDIRYAFHDDNLIIDEDIFELLVPDDIEVEARTLVEQLRLISHSSTAIALALKDYYRAFVQRQRWTMGRIVRSGEIGVYERRLQHEWEHYWATRRPSDFECTRKAETDLVQFGQAAYNEMTSRPIRIRPLCVDQIIVRGSYHLLANEQRVGWHPLFVNRLAELLGQRSA